MFSAWKQQLAREETQRLDLSVEEETGSERQRETAPSVDKETEPAHFRMKSKRPEQLFRYNHLLETDRDRDRDRDRGRQSEQTVSAGSDMSDDNEPAGEELEERTSTLGYTDKTLERRVAALEQNVTVLWKRDSERGGVSWQTVVAAAVAVLAAVIAVAALVALTLGIVSERTPGE